MGRLTEGWTWLTNSRKWHYFVEGRSLCSKWMLFGNPTLETGTDDSRFWHIATLDRYDLGDAFVRAREHIRASRNVQRAVHDEPSDHGQACHDPLCIRVVRRELGPPAPLGRAVMFLGIFCALGVWGSYLLIGWLTKPRDTNNRRER